MQMICDAKPENNKNNRYTKDINVNTEYQIKSEGGKNNKKRDSREARMPSQNILMVYLRINVADV